MSCGKWLRLKAVPETERCSQTILKICFSNYGSQIVRQSRFATILRNDAAVSQTSKRPALADFTPLDLVRATDSFYPWDSSFLASGRCINYHGCA